MHSRKSGFRHSLGTRLVWATLGFSLAFTLMAVAARTYLAWQETWAAVNADLMLVEQVYQQTLSKAIWEMDREALQVHMDSAAKVDTVGHIRLTMASKTRAPEVLERTAPGWQTSTLAPTRRLDLVYAPYPGALEHVGELLLAGDERVLWAHLRGEVLNIVLAQLLQSLLLAGLIMLVFSRTVTTHVQQIAQHLSQLTPQAMGEPLRLQRNPALQDELTLLENGVNQLQGKLADHLVRQQQYENELAQHRDHLADMVLARTTALESLSQAQQLVLALSNQLIHASHDSFDSVQQACLAQVAQHLGALHALWLIPIQGQAGFSLYAQWQANGGQDALPSPAALDGLTGVPTQLAREELLFFTSPDDLRRRLSAPEARVFGSLAMGGSALALLRGEDENYGLLFFAKPAAQRSWPPEHQALVTMTAQMLLQSMRHNIQLSHIIASQQALRQANQQLETLSRHDALTGLFNRRHFDEIKNDEFQRAMRSGQPLSLLVCDIDFFKAYNDHYGHASGDQCLQAVAQAMLQAVPRGGDVLTRIGGEEFAVLLPATTQASAWLVAERLRLAVANLHLAHDQSSVGPWVTISIGLAQLQPGQHSCFDDLFEAADQALYRAKEAGRNRAVSAKNAVL